MSGIVDKVIETKATWMSGKYPESDIILTSRARLARNLQNIHFVDRASEAEKEKVIQQVLEASTRTPILKKAHYFDFNSLDVLDRILFVEKRLVSSEFAEAAHMRGLLVTEDGNISVMINEEDHIRMQIITGGFSLEDAWYPIRKLEQELSGHLAFASSDRFGYLTACPSNVGTAVRFSVFIHLPALVFTRKIESVFEQTIPAGIAIRGFYGEGSKIVGNFFQISNQYTLGWTEQGILDRIIPLIRNVLAKEREARTLLLNEQRLQIEDKIYRALGILSNARILSTMEFIDLISAIKLGVDLNLLKGLKDVAFNEMLMYAQPAHIQKSKGKVLPELERDRIRADWIRERLHLN